MYSPDCTKVLAKLPKGVVEDRPFARKTKQLRNSEIKFQGGSEWFYASWEGSDSQRTMRHLRRKLALLPKAFEDVKKVVALKPILNLTC
jgi:hypothetical protein